MTGGAGPGVFHGKPDNMIPREVRMKRAAQVLIAAFVLGCFAGHGLAQDQVGLFDGFWKTKRGSIVKIDGDQGVFVYTPVESWKSYVDQVVIKNIRQKDDKWLAEEYIAPDGKGFWAEIEWELDDERIIRRVLFQGQIVESYYEKIDSYSANPGHHTGGNPHRDIAGRLGLGARVAYTHYYEDGYDMSGFEVDTDPDAAAMYGVNLTYFLHRYFSLELSVDYVKTDVELSFLGLSRDGGELEQVPVLLTARTHFSTNPKVNPYVSAGVGYYFNSFDSERVMAEWIYGAGADIDVDDSIGYHAGGGIEFFVADDFAISLDLKYIWNNVDLDVNIAGVDDDNFDVNVFVAGVGFKYYF